MKFYDEETDRDLWAGDGKCHCGKTAVARIWGEEGIYVCIEHFLVDLRESPSGTHMHSLIFEGKEYILNGYRGLELVPHDSTNDGVYDIATGKHA